MIKIERSRYPQFIPQAAASPCNRVYPCSIAEGRQAGDIFVSEGGDPAVLFWHRCGFGYLSGAATERFLEEILYEAASSETGRRLLLITNDETARRFCAFRGIAAGERIEYVWKRLETGLSAPEGIMLVPLDPELLMHLRGRITPRFSWESPERFLSGGFGFAALDGEAVCGAAFSAAVSTEETDIGVEVAEEYRNRGIASALARAMCSEILHRGKRPVWAHAASNAASRRTALHCGFTEIRRNACFLIQNAQNDWNGGN